VLSEDFFEEKDRMSTDIHILVKIKEFVSKVVLVVGGGGIYYVCLCVCECVIVRERERERGQKRGMRICV
jgi:hypothetical protein